MKENVLDVLMYLFQNYMYDDDTDVEPDRESVETELLEAGFPSHEIQKALDWLDDLVDRQETPIAVGNAERSFRIYTPQETGKLDVECRGFLLFLEQTGILSAETRELVIDRVMALNSEDMDLSQLRLIILLVLFNQPGQEEAYAWMEDLVFDDVVDNIH